MHLQIYYALSLFILFIPLSGHHTLLSLLSSPSPSPLYGAVGMKILDNVVTVIDFIIDLLPNRWGNIKLIFIKITMGPPKCIYGSYLVSFKLNVHI